MIGLIENAHGVERYQCGCLVQRWPYKNSIRRVRATICSPKHAELLYEIVMEMKPQLHPEQSAMTFDEKE